MIAALRKLVPARDALLPPCLACAGGLACFAGRDAHWVALGSWLGVALLCEALVRTSSRRGAFAIGLAFGFAANALALWSLGPLLVGYAGMAPLFSWSVALLTWLVQGTPYALAAVFRDALHRRGWPAGFALACPLVVALALWPQIFPWHLGALQVGFLSFAQLAELGGESLLGLVFVTIVASAHAAIRARGTARIAHVSLAVLALGSAVAYGSARIPALERTRAAAPKLRVGVVQANAGIPEGVDEAHARASLTVLKAMTVPLERRGAQLTVWGETAYPYPLLRSLRHAPDDVRAMLGDGVTGPLLVGVETYADLEDETLKYNSAWLVRRDGRLSDRVDKTQLIPFGEYVPLWHALPLLRDHFRSPGFTAGTPGIVRVEREELGVLICYEDLFARVARESVRSGARALINLTNDVWFGPSRVPFLHDLMARLRAIEQRRDLVRAVDSGRSSFTSASGEQRTHTRPFTRASFIAEVALLDGRTAYARLGDLTSPACALSILLALARRHRALKARPAA